MYMLKARHISWKEKQVRELRLTHIQAETVHAHECVVEVDAPTSGPRCVAPGLRGLRGSSGGASIPRAPPPEAQKGRAYCEIPPRKHRPMLTPLDSVFPVPFKDMNLSPWPTLLGLSVICNARKILG